MPKYLITGGTGFLGRELIKRTQGANILVVARNEGKLIALKEEFPWIDIMPGDIADSSIVEKAMQTGVTGIYHLAAFKHVGLAEQNVLQCVQTNIAGTVNILRSSLRHHSDFVVGISSDKAARVSGVYGATKFLMEKLFLDYSEFNPRTKYRVVRYGNVIYSTGSVLCKWKEKLQKDEEVIITDPDATRFYWTVEQAVDLIDDCLLNADSAEPYVTAMKAVRVGDLLTAMSRKYAVRAFPKVKTIGLQPGENKHEKISDDLPDSEHAEKYTVEEILKFI